MNKNFLSFFSMALLAFTIGALSAIAVLFFQILLAFVHNLTFLGRIDFNYAKISHTPLSPFGASIILVPILGSFLVTWLIERFAFNQRGLSVSQAMYQIDYCEGKMDLKGALAKVLASIISIGTGGSVGREGPITQIAGALGAASSDFFQFYGNQRRVLIVGAIAAGTTAIFHAPFTGTVFAIELFLLTINLYTLSLVALSTIGAVAVLFLTAHPLSLTAFVGLSISHNIPAFTWHILLYLAIGVIFGLISLAFIKGLAWFEWLFNRYLTHPYARHALGMGTVGIMLYLFAYTTGQYYIEGIGMATLRDILTRTLVDPRFLLILCLGKYLATCITLGSGASGGIFAPSLYLGATLGACLAGLGNAYFPGVGIDPVLFTLTGMAAVFAGATGAVITGIVLLLELTGTLSLTLPLALAVFAAIGTRMAFCPDSAYTQKLKQIIRSHQGS